MPLAINTVTGIVRSYPMNVIRHRVLGKNLEVYVEPELDDEVEEDKVVIAKKVYTKKSNAPAEDVTNTDTEQEPVVTFSTYSEVTD